MADVFNSNCDDIFRFWLVGERFGDKRRDNGCFVIASAMADLVHIAIDALNNKNLALNCNFDNIVLSPDALNDC